MRFASRFVLSILLLVAIPIFAFPARVDIKGVIKSLDEATVTIEAHGQQLSIPRDAFEDKEALSVGSVGKARLEWSDLKRVRSARK